jgi:hypothetical protein
VFRNIGTRIEEKVVRDQADRVVLNLGFAGLLDGVSDWWNGLGPGGQGMVVDTENNRNTDVHRTVLVGDSANHASNIKKHGTHAPMPLRNSGTTMHASTTTATLTSPAIRATEPTRGCDPSHACQQSATRCHHST